MVFEGIINLGWFGVPTPVYVGGLARLGWTNLYIGFFKGKGLDIQQGTSVWVGLLKSGGLLLSWLYEKF